MQITIPFKTPTINHLYWHRGNIKIMTKEARELKEKIKEIVGETRPYTERPLRVVVDIYENWYLMDGETISKKDVANREKFLIDAIFAALETDDKFIFEQTLKKNQSLTEEKAIITIEAL